MPDAEKPIPTHTEWKTLKKKHGVADLSVSGVDIGKALESYHGKKKHGSKHARANGRAAQVLADVFDKYIAKLPKGTKRPKTFDDEVKDCRDAAQHNATYFEQCAKDIEDFAKVMQRFAVAVKQLPKAGATLQQLEQFRDGGTAQALIEAAQRESAGPDLTSVQPSIAGIKKGMDKGLAALLGARRDEAKQEYIDTWTDALHSMTDTLVAKISTLVGG